MSKYSGQGHRKPSKIAGQPASGTHRRSKFQPWRTSNVARAPVTVRSLETGEVLRVEDPVGEGRKARAARRRKSAEGAQRAHKHAELNLGWDAAVQRDEVNE